MTSNPNLPKIVNVKNKYRQAYMQKLIYFIANLNFSDNGRQMSSNKNRETKFTKLRNREYLILESKPLSPINLLTFQYPFPPSIQLIS